MFPVKLLCCCFMLLDTAFMLCFSFVPGEFDADDNVSLFNCLFTL